MKKSTKNILIAIGCLYLADIIICLSWEKSRKLTKQMIDKMTEIEKLQISRLSGKVNKHYTNMEDEKLQKAQRIIDEVNCPNRYWHLNAEGQESMNEFKNKMAAVIKNHEEQYGTVKLDEI